MTEKTTLTADGDYSRIEERLAAFYAEGNAFVSPDFHTCKSPTGRTAQDPPRQDLPRVPAAWDDWKPGRDVA